MLSRFSIISIIVDHLVPEIPLLNIPGKLPEVYHHYPHCVQHQHHHHCVQRNNHRHHHCFHLFYHHHIINVITILFKIINRIVFMIMVYYVFTLARIEAPACPQESRPWHLTPPIHWIFKDAFFCQHFCNHQSCDPFHKHPH